MKSETVFSRRKDELQHSSYNTRIQSRSVSIERNFPDNIGEMPSCSVNIFVLTLSIIIESNNFNRFNPERGP